MDQSVQQELAERIRNGDKEAFELLFRMHYAGLCTFACSFVKSRYIAEEVVQDTFLTIWQKREAWIPKGSLKSYLYRIARNHALNYLKHRRVVWAWEQEEKQYERYAESTPLTEMDSKEFAAHIHRIIDEMPERRRLVFVLSRHHGLTYAEVATVLGISVKTVETQIGRALKTLRDELATLYPGTHAE